MTVGDDVVGLTVGDRVGGVVMGDDVVDVVGAAVDTTFSKHEHPLVPDAW